MRSKSKYQSDDEASFSLNVYWPLHGNEKWDAPYKKRSKGGEWRSTGGAWGNVGSNLANQRLPKMRKCQHHHSILYSIPCVEATLTHGDGQFLLYIVTAETNPSASQKRLHLFLFYIQWSEALWPVTTHTSSFWQIPFDFPSAWNWKHSGLLSNPLKVIDTMQIGQMSSAPVARKTQSVWWGVIIL